MGFDRKKLTTCTKKMGNVSRWIMEILQKNQKVILVIKTFSQKYETSLMGLPVCLMRTRKELGSLKI